MALQLSKDQTTLDPITGKAVYSTGATPITQSTTTNPGVAAIPAPTVITRADANADLNKISLAKTAAQLEQEKLTAEKKAADTTNYQAQLDESKAQLAALQKYGLTNTADIAKDSSGNWVPISGAVESKDKTSDIIGNYLGQNTTQGIQQKYTDYYNSTTKIGETPLTRAEWEAEGMPSAKPEVAKTPQEIEIDRIKAKQAETQNLLNKALAGEIPLNPNQKFQMESLSASYDDLIRQQEIANKNYQGAISKLGARSGRDIYASKTHQGEVDASISLGLSKIKSLNNDKVGALAKLEEGFQTNNIKLIQQSYDNFMNAEKEITAGLKDMSDKIAAQQKMVFEANQKVQEKLTTDINNVLASLAKTPGVPESVKTAVANSTSLSEALKSAGTWLETGDGDIGEWVQYKRDQISNGLTVKDFTSWQAEKEATALKQKSAEAYSSAYASAKGKAAGEAAAGVGTTTEEIASTNPDSQSILSQTGLSIAAFNYLVQGTSALSRMSETSRKSVMTEAQNFLNKNGIDFSTFSSQFKAYNNTLQANIMRVNQVKVAEKELQGTMNNLKAAADDASFGKLNAFNVGRMFAGKETNDPNVLRYKFHLTQLRQEFAMYNAAAAGKITQDGIVRVDDGDLREAEKTITNGISSKSIEGLETALIDSVKKMEPILDASVNNSRQMVWEMFGVGDKFNPPAKTFKNPQEYINYSEENEANFITQTSFLKETLGREPTAEEVFEFINQK